MRFARVPAAVLIGCVVASLLAGSSGAPLAPAGGHAVGPAVIDPALRDGAVRGASTPRALPAAPSPLSDPHWANRTIAGVAAPPAGPSVMVYDGADGYVLWYGLTSPGQSGGATWTFSSGTWVNRTATAGTGPTGATWGTAAFDASDGYVVWYGGTSAVSSDATWSFAAGKWSNLTASLASQPTPDRMLASAAYDPALGAVVVFGGYDGSAYLADTWEFVHGAWSSVAATASPSARVSAGLAFDGADGDLVLAGGGTAAGPASDTWTFNGTNWTERIATQGPAGIGGAQGLTSAPGGSVIGFGGVGCVAPWQGPCNLTEEFVSGAWQAVPEPSGPSARSGMQLVYDANDGSVLAWGGTTGAALHNDTWALGGPLYLTAKADPALVGVDDPAYFDAYAGGGYGNYSFTWTGVPPDCPVVNASVMECESEIPLNYTLVSHLSDTAGNATTALAGFQVLHQLSAGIIITPSTIDLGQSAALSLDIIGGGPVVNYSWVGLPVGCSSAYRATVNCTPVNPGYYSIVVTIVDDLGHVAATPDLALVVNALPSVGIWSNVTLGAAPLPVQFFSSVFGGSPTYAFHWTFGDGGSSTVPDPAHVFAASGVYAVGLTVTDARGGVAAAANLTLDVVNPLLIQAQASQTYPDVGQSVAFAAVVSGGGTPYTYAWTFGDGGTASVADPSHAFSSGGAHTIVLEVTDAQGVHAVASVVVDVQGAGATGSGSSSIFASPWVDGLIGAMIGIAVSTFAFRSPAPPPPPARPEPRAADPPTPADGGGPAHSESTTTRPAP